MLDYSTSLGEYEGRFVEKLSVESAVHSFWRGGMGNDWLNLTVYPIRHPETLGDNVQPMHGKWMTKVVTVELTCRFVSSDCFTSDIFMRKDHNKKSSISV